MSMYGASRYIETEPAELYREAARKATAKQIHNAEAGTLDLGPDYYRTAGTCLGRLRTIYVRVTVPSSNRREAGSPKWESVGVLCDSCRMHWPRQDAELERLLKAVR